MSLGHNNLLSMLNHSVQDYADRTALLTPTDDDYTDISYGILWRSVQRIAARLQVLGVGTETKVGLLAETKGWWPMADFAILSLGACTVPVYPSLPANQVLQIVQHAEMVGMFIQNEKQASKILSASPQTLPFLKFVVVLEPMLTPDIIWGLQARFEVHSLADWLASDPVPVQLRPEWQANWTNGWKAIAPEDLATIVYTSGTTGMPKGVMLSHGNLLSNVDGCRRYVRILPTDRSLSYLPLSHIFERTAGQFALLEAGACICYSRGFEHLADELQQMPPTVMTTVPRLLEKVYEQIMRQIKHAPVWKQRLFHAAVRMGTEVRVHKQRQMDWKFRLLDRLVFAKIRASVGPSLRMMIVGGAPMPAYVGHFFTAAGLTVSEGYGMTETSPVIACNLPDSIRLGSAGKILSNVEVIIADDGEVLVRGPSVMKGYYRDAAATAEAFDPEGWFKTGDIGHVTEDGYLWITDRKKNLIVLSTGKKVTPAPIEADILQSEWIDQVLLVGQGRKYISAVVVPHLDILKSWALAQGLLTEGAKWVNQPEVADYLLSQIQPALRAYAAFEQPKKLLVVAQPFTVDNGQLTPTLKVKAKQVLEHYSREMEMLYADTQTEVG